MKVKLSPCRYPGGKSNALKTLDPYFPENFDFYREPFFGGGSVGLYLMQKNKNAEYWINDLFYPVYCFWKTIYNHPSEMVSAIWNEKQKYVVSNEIITKGTPSKSALKGAALHAACRKKIEESIQIKNEFATACLWYILNKTSFSGMAMIGSYAPLAFDQNFTNKCILNLPKTHELMHSVKNVQITNLDYLELLKNDDTNTFIFLDPPYKIPHSLYGKDGDMNERFDHLRFSTDVKDSKHKWMITYNEDEHIKSWFREFNPISWDLQYTMQAAKRKGQEGSATTGKSGKKGKELLILNYEQRT
jgi:DNA adenine methylase